jgi:hypothetical protein
MDQCGHDLRVARFLTIVKQGLCHGTVTLQFIVDELRASTSIEAAFAAINRRVPAHSVTAAALPLK